MQKLSTDGPTFLAQHSCTPLLTFLPNWCIPHCKN